MDYKERYMHALEKIREGLKPLPDGAKISGVTRAFLEEVFPELKESEDELTWLTKFIEEEAYSLSMDIRDNFDRIKLKNLQKSLAWLEKQGEQKVPINDFKAKNWYVSEVDGKIHDMTYNPTDKDEPKFKVGDWIVNDYCYGKVIALTDDAYLLDSGQGIPFSCEHNVHLWTIQDAKDGDVLACGDKVTDCPFIFHNLTKELNPRSYCGVNTLCHFQDNDENGGFWCKSDEVRPATKEQRDLLFQKMKEEGYEWDAEKKELNKIEDEIEIPFGAKDSELQEVTYYIPKGFHAEIDDDKVVIKKGKKPAEWSEDDERIVTALMEGFRYHQLFNPRFGEVPNAEIISWIKSLKERLS